MGFRYQLCKPDGEVFSEAECGYEPSAGDEAYVCGNRRMRVLAVVPLELAGEFVDKPLYGMLEVEPV
jgi:hypothetical protein